MGTFDRNLVWFIFLLLFACPIWGQAAQKKLTVADYEKFGTLSIKALSGDGKWVCYEMHYENSEDTLFLQNTRTKAITAFPKGKEVSFGGNNFFAFKKDSLLMLRLLKSSKMEIIRDVKRFEFTDNGRYLLTLHYNKDLQVRDVQGRIIQTINSVAEYNWNDNINRVLYYCSGEGSYTIWAFDLNQRKKRLLTSGNQFLKKIIWNTKGDKAVFMSGDALHYSDFKQNQSYSLTLAALAEKGYKIMDRNQYPIVISKESEKVFFSVTADKKMSAEFNSEPEVWNGNDPCLYPVKKNLATTNIPLLAVWFPETGIFKVLNNESHYMVRLSGKNDYVVYADPFRYGTIPKYYEEVDYYIKNVSTGKEKLLLEKQSHDPNQFCFSPYSNAMVYYRERHWWLYNPDDDITICLTKSINVQWDNSYEIPHQFRVYGIAAWAEDRKSILIYDKFDLWIVSLNGSGCERITAGREKQIKYRISKTPQILFINKHDVAQPSVDLEDDILLEAENLSDWSTGYGIYNVRKGFRMLEYQSAYLTDFQKSSIGSIVYRMETFANPPQIVIWDIKNEKSEQLYQSNNEYMQFEKRKSELIRYFDSQGYPLKAALFYPDNYDTNQQYPMIVSIYDIKSKEIHHFNKPTLFNEIGYSISNFTSNGYFVLYPDIRYRIGNPGISATECVMAAVNSATSAANIDKKKIGLMGHSFGGYETNFIITQTPMFAAAVSGAGVSDPISRYFELGKDSVHKDEMWRFESQQFRMGASFYANKKDYWMNSPIVHAEKITTSLLQWAGKDDPTVPFDQSVSLYMALRRLGLQTILLLYPQEGHYLRKAKNQIDLTNRLMQWFDYYLKGKEDVQWIKEGTIFE